MTNSCSKKDAKLSIAVIDKNIDEVNSLLGKGANASSICISDGITPLLMSSYHGETDILKKLLEYGASINEQNVKGASALIMASVNGDEKTVETLLDIDGIDLNMVDTKGFPALTFAAMNNFPKITKMLLDAGADNSIRDIYHRSALDHSIIKGSTDSLDALLTYSTKKLTEDDMIMAHHFAVKHSSTDTIQKMDDMMLDNGLMVMDIGSGLSLSLKTLDGNNEEMPI